MTDDDDLPAACRRPTRHPDDLAACTTDSRRSDEAEGSSTSPTAPSTARSAAAARRDRHRPGAGRLRHARTTTGPADPPIGSARDPARTRPARRRRPRAREYFAGTPTDVRRAARLALSAGFRATVLRQLPTSATATPPATRPSPPLAGNPKAVRAVGTACATNPLPVVMPCHRVVRSDGTMGGYLGGVEAKRTLLTLEDVV